MKKATIYHNPRCSKSRQTLQLLKESGITPRIILYLKNPPSISDLKTLIQQLNCAAENLVRKKDAAYKTLHFNEQHATESDWITLLHQHPALLERPIVIANNKAVLGRPPENVLEIL